MELRTKVKWDNRSRLHSYSPPAQQGFTLVELLVVIAIIGVLVALLLPAIQAAREAARRTQCNNNLKQLALACLNYHDSNKRFPLGSEWDKSMSSKEYGTTNHLNPNWIIRLLPHLEQQVIFDSFDFRVSIADPVNEVARSTVIESLLCPSDFNNSTPFDGTGAKQNQGANWARGNYAANSENSALGAAVRWEWSAENAWFDGRRRGVMGTNQGSTIAEITDGTSNTLLCAEVRTGVVPVDVRGTWALSGPGSSLYWHGWHDGAQGSANGPNDCSVNSDDLPRCFDITIASGGVASLVNDCMACKLSIGSEIQTGVRSQHPGGVQVALCDGSTHWVGDDIETSRECCSAWDRLILSQDGEVGPRGF